MRNSNEGVKVAIGRRLNRLGLHNKFLYPNLVGHKLPDCCRIFQFTVGDVLKMMQYAFCDPGAYFLDVDITNVQLTSIGGGGVHKTKLILEACLGASIVRR